MGMPALMLSMVQQVAKDRGRGGTMLSAGYPDMLLTQGQMTGILGPDKAATLPVRPDSAQIIAWHAASSWLDRVFDSSAVLACLGFELDVLDVRQVRGDEHIVDLNQPLPATFSRSYDLVLDTGTCEHCFNIGQAAINLASLVAKDGYIIQALPLSSFNHGFYNVNPTWFHDFYPANGFQLLYLKGIVDIVQNPQLFDLPGTERFNGVPDNAVMVVVARRTEIRPLAIPIQAKYRSNPGLAGSAPAR